MRREDRDEAVRMLKVMSDSDFMLARVISKKAGLSQATTQRLLLRLGQSVVDWKLAAPGNERTMPLVYHWRRQPGAVERVASL